MARPALITGTARAVLRRMLTADYRAGRTVDEIALTYHTSWSTAYRLLREGGCPMRRRGPRATRAA